MTTARLATRQGADIMIPDTITLLVDTRDCPIILAGSQCAAATFARRYLSGQHRGIKRAARRAEPKEATP
jgi:hypothetical protein